MSLGNSLGARRAAPVPLADYVLGDESMEDRAHEPEAIDEADARFRDPRTLDQIVANVPVIMS